MTTTHVHSLHKQNSPLSRLDFFFLGSCADTINAEKPKFYTSTLKLIQIKFNQMQVFEERGKLESPGENLSEQKREENQQTQPTYDAESNSDHSGGRRVLSPLRHHCPPYILLWQTSKPIKSNRPSSGIDIGALRSILLLSVLMKISRYFKAVGRFWQNKNTISFLYTIPNCTEEQQYTILSTIDSCTL